MGGMQGGRQGEAGERVGEWVRVVGGSWRWKLTVSEDSCLRSSLANQIRPAFMQGSLLPGSCLCSKGQTGVDFGG